MRERAEINETRRPINPGAEKWLGKEIKVLDHGFIRLVDYMGNDLSFVDAARVSYQRGTKSVSNDEGLIRYLRRNRHTSPFEMAEMVFHVKLPIFVARQWVRHRTASLNEESARYSILEDEFYIPESSSVCVQSKSNNQGRGENVDEEYARKFQIDLEGLSLAQYAFYKEYLNDRGDKTPMDATRPMIARELARVSLGLNYYTQWYWKCDLHNIFHFLELRMDQHAQWEIRQYAEAMATIVKDSFPIAWKAFEDYVINSVTLSHQEVNIIGEILASGKTRVTRDEFLSIAGQRGIGKTERLEMVEKFKKIGFIDQPEA